jgi:hypothetical protein
MLSKILFSCFALLAVNASVTNVAFSEGSINMFHQVRSEAEDLRNEPINRQNMLLEEQYLRDVKMYQVNSKQYLLDNEKEHKKIDETLKKLESLEEANKKWFVDNEALLVKHNDAIAKAEDDTTRITLLEASIKELEESLAKMETIYKGLSNKAKELERSIGIVNYDVLDPKTIEEIEQIVLTALAMIQFDENRIEEADAIKQNIIHGGDGTVLVYDEHMIEKVQKQIMVTYEEMSFWETLMQQDYKVVDDLLVLRDAFEARMDIARELLDLRKWQEDLYKYDEELQKELVQLAADQKKIEQTLEGKQFGKYAGMRFEYYSWDASDGSKGSQFVVPIEYFASHGYNEFGFSTGYVNTSTKYPEEDIMNGMRALEVHYGRRNPHKRYTLKYNLDMSIPLGESRTNRRALSDDLVAVTRLNEGFNIGPSIDIERRDGEENIWRLGVGYNFKGDYHYSKENPSFSVSPGDALDGYLNWTHAEDDHQMRFGVEGIFKGKSNENGTRYREGEERLYKAMYNKCLNEKSDVMAYFWVRENGSNTYYTPPFSSGGGKSRVRYYGLEYKFKLDENRAWFIRNNNMLSTGTYNDVLTGETINGRKKHTLGVGYKIKLASDETLSLNADYFWMKDKDTGKDYDGAEFMVFYNRAI